MILFHQGTKNISLLTMKMVSSLVECKVWHGWQWPELVRLDQSDKSRVQEIASLINLEDFRHCAHVG